MSKVDIDAWTEFLLEASNSGVEASICDLLDWLTGGSMALLAGHQWLMEMCTRHSIAVSPSLSVGNPGEVRLFRRWTTPLSNPKSELALGESARQEFKSSLLFDRKRVANDPSASSDQLRSELVLHSSLKTVAAFLNAEGGVLWIGVDDQGMSAGISDDLVVLGREPGDVDGFELIFRGHLTSRFVNGASIGDYLSVSFHEVDGLFVARVDVTRRIRLSYLKRKDGESELFVRQGNLTRQLKLDEVEEFVLARNGSVVG